MTAFPFPGGKPQGGRTKQWEMERERGRWKGKKRRWKGKEGDEKKKKGDGKRKREMEKKRICGAKRRQAVSRHPTVLSATPPDTPDSATMIRMCQGCQVVVNQHPCGSRGNHETMHMHDTSAMPCALVCMCQICQ